MYWILQKSFVITSVGFGGAEDSICGKTELNNKLFFSNFVESSRRNKVCQGCPEILFDIYKNEKRPVNLIDIPSGVDKMIINRILENSNMLIIHSVKDAETTKKYVGEISNKVPTVIIYRDTPASFSNIKSFKQDLINRVKTANETQLVEIAIEDLSTDDRSNEIKFISSRIHEFIIECFENTKNKDLWKFANFFEHCSEKFNDILEKIQVNSSQLTQVTPIFSKLKQIEMDDKDYDKKEQEKRDLIASAINKNWLATEIYELSNFLIESNKSSSDNAKLFFGKLQEHLRMMKSQKTKDHYQLYNFKSDFSKIKLDDEEEKLSKFFEYWEVLKRNDSHYQHVTIERNSNKSQLYESIGKCIEIFEQKVIPSIFSIELFWRELIYFTTMVKEYSNKISGEQNGEKSIQGSAVLLDFLVRLRKDNILNGFPFEVIDGDLLYMPKEFYKTVFKGLNDRIAVVSILGPQSSGKSTLLNFLFGCDFTTSSGRCTKGIYGTYFKVSNFNACDGILVLDTEGLFGLLNKNEARHRDKFDRKLILFCLAVSDFVVVNFKGDIDKNLSDVLKVCKESLVKLQQGNIQSPEMFWH